MKLECVTMEGYRSFADETRFDDLASINLLVGRNNVGKSNLVLFLQLLCGFARGSAPISGLEMLSRGHDRMNFEVLLKPTKGDREEIIRWYVGGRSDLESALGSSRFCGQITHRFAADATGLTSDRLFVSNVLDGELQIWEGYSRDGGRTDLGWTNQIQTGSLTPPSLKNLGDNRQKHGGAMPGNPWVLFQNATPVDHIVERVRNLYLGVDWVLPLRETPSQLAPQEISRLDPRGGNLPQVWGTLLGDDTEALVRIGRDIGNTVEDVATIGAPTRGSQVRPFIREKSGQNFDLANTSTGISQLSILVTKLARAHAGSILCIEEPELHLHAGAQRRLRKLIGDRSSDVQFFVTTHSTVFLKGPGESRTFLLTREQSQSKVRVLTSPEDFRDLRWELGTSNADLFSFDVVLLVEGESEEAFLPRVAQHLGLDFASRGIMLLRLGGKDIISKLGHLLAYLEASDTAPFIVLDHDERLREKLLEWERSGLLPEGRFEMWDREFEDLFSLDIVLRALAMAGIPSVAKDKVAQYLPNSTMVKALSRVLFEENLGEFSKPEVASRLAELVESNEVPPPEPVAHLIAQLDKLTKI